MTDGITTKHINIHDVKPHPRNVRQGDIGMITESLRAHGQYRPIVVQTSTGHILAGNHTWKAAVTLGWKKIHASFIDVDDDKALRIMLVDNRANDLATYDDHRLSELLQELAVNDAQLDGTGYTPDDLDDMIARMSDLLDITPNEFPSFDESIPTEHQCPKCGYQWSGPSA